MFRQDLQDKQDVFAFPACHVESGEERQKVSSHLEESRLLIAPTNSNARGKASVVDSSDFFPLKWNCVFTASSGSRKINQVDPVNPVRKNFGFMSK